MNIGVPRYLIVGMAALFSGYHLVLAAYSLGQPAVRSPLPVLSRRWRSTRSRRSLSLLPCGPTRMPDLDGGIQLWLS